MSRFKTKTHEQFMKEFYDQIDDEYIILENYKGCKVKIRIFHNTCQREFLSSPDNFLNNKRRCPHCFRRFKKTQEQFVQEIHNLVGDEYTILSQYINTNTHVKIKHNTCGYVYLVKPGNFLTGYRCPIHQHDTTRKTHEQFIQEVFDLVGDEYTVKEKYISSGKKIKLLHKKCGNIIHISPQHFLHNRRCVICFRERQRKIIRKSQEDFKKEVFDLVGDEYTVLGKYEKYNKKIEIRHNKCGRKYTITPQLLFSKKGCCIYCSESNYESFIRIFFEKKNIIFEREFSFKDCRDKHPLRFDFQVFIPNTNLWFLLEYDGYQHFELNGRIQKEKRIENLKYIQNHDRIKNQYCKDNNILLIRIDYRQNLEKQLNFIYERFMGLFSKKPHLYERFSKGSRKIRL